MTEKREFTKWWILIVVLLLLTIPTFFALNSAGLFFGKKVERAVLVNSHQYIEGMTQRGAVLTGSLMEAQARLAAETDPEVRRSIESQISVLKAQLNALRIQE